VRFLVVYLYLTIFTMHAVLGMALSGHTFVKVLDGNELHAILLDEWTAV